VARVDFSEILRVLHRHEVEFVTVGGLAAVFNGAPVTTVDVDILHRRTPENVARLLSALRELEAVYRQDPRNTAPGESHLLGPGHQLLRTKHGDLDVLGTIDDTVVYDDVLGHTIEVEISDFRVLALDLERVIQAKEFAGRPKDLATLPVLRATLAELKKSKDQS
jgi:predicted nucleotidyltransferase